MIGTNEFREAIQSIGLKPPDMIEPGRLHRFPGAGKRNGNTAAWCKLFPDGIGGVYGDHSQDISAHWQAARSAPFTPAEREAFNRQIAEAKASAEAERKQRQSEAAAKAVSIWQAATPAPIDHAYLVRKGIKPHGAKLHNGALVIAVREGADIHSLQFIGEDGAKRFLKDGRVAGGYFSIGATRGAAALCIAEGFATGATIHELTGYPVAVAFNAGNLEAVAIALRAKLPDMPIIVCADDDLTAGNPGRTKATAAALAISARLALPDFGEPRGADATDFNDMAKHCSAEAVKHAIGEVLSPSKLAELAELALSKSPSSWSAPHPLITKVEPEPYPLDALPTTIRAAVIEVQGFTKAPIAMVALSAMSALSLAIQAQVNVGRAHGLTGPCSLFGLVIADSGERKSTCDGKFTNSIREHEAQQAEIAKPLIREYNAAMAAWDAKRNGIKDKIRQLAKDSKPTQEYEEKLRDLENHEPMKPKVPRLIYADATPEALTHSLYKNWPSGGVVSAEAGSVLGAHGMGSESVMRNLAMFNQLWDGNPLSIDRRTSESYTVRGARLTIALQVQEATLRDFLARSGALARGTGFLARFLLAWPESTQGYRAFTEPPESWPAMEAFNQRIANILNSSIPLNADGTLSPVLLTLTHDAKAAWIAYHDAIECELKNSGELYDVRDVAAKSADNAARIAALFHVFESNQSNEVSIDSLNGATRIAAWHLNESRRFFGELALPKILADAARLEAWLIEYCKRESVFFIPIAALMQIGPGSLRRKKAHDPAIHELATLNRLRVVSNGRNSVIELNPAIIKGGEV